MAPERGGYYDMLKRERAKGPSADTKPFRRTPEQSPRREEMSAPRAERGAVENAGVIQAIINRQIRTELEPYFPKGPGSQVKLDKATSDLSRQLLTEIVAAKGLSAGEKRALVHKRVDAYLTANQMKPEAVELVDGEEAPSEDAAVRLENRTIPHVIDDEPGNAAARIPAPEGTRRSDATDTTHLGESAMERMQKEQTMLSSQYQAAGAFLVRSEMNRLGMTRSQVRENLSAKLQATVKEVNALAKKEDPKFDVALRRQRYLYAALEELDRLDREEPETPKLASRETLPETVDVLGGEDEVAPAEQAPVPIRRPLPSIRRTAPRRTSPVGAPARVLPSDPSQTDFDLIGEEDGT